MADEEAALAAHYGKEPRAAGTTPGGKASKWAITTRLNLNEQSSWNEAETRILTLIKFYVEELGNIVSKKLKS